VFENQQLIAAVTGGCTSGSEAMREREKYREREREKEADHCRPSTDHLLSSVT
jgi:hypothetical protein